MAQSKPISKKSELERVWQIIDAAKIAMLVTRDGDQLHARPMGVQAECKENALWFISSLSSHKDEQIEDDNRVCVVFEDRDAGIYLSVAGRGEVVTDREIIEQHWTKDADLWFAGGSSDPDACLLKITPEGSKLWDTPSQKDAERKMDKAHSGQLGGHLGHSTEVAMH